MKKVSILALHLGYGGIERSIVSLANMLCSKYQVEIACSYKLYEKSGFLLDERVKVNYLIDDKVPNKDKFLKSLRSFNVIGVIKEGVYSLDVLRLRKRTMVNYIKKGEYDVIISSRDIFNFWVSKYARGDALKIAWEHNHYHGDFKYANRIVKSVYGCDRLVLVSLGLYEFYKAYMKNSKCVPLYIPNVIDEIPKRYSSLKEKRMVSVGRLSLEKGFLDLLKIFKEITLDDDEWVLDIIGEGSERKVLEEYISNNNLKNRVVLHGFCDRDYIYQIFLNSSIYLMTSFTESFGIVLIEAMSVGLPCISFSSAEGACEIIKDNVNGFLVDNRDFSIYTEKVKLLMNDYKLRKSIGESARSGVSKYLASNVVDDWISLLDKK